MNTLMSDPSLFLMMFDHLHEGVVIHASDTSILYANMAASEILGLSTEELQGKKAIDSAWYFVDEALNQLSEDQYPIVRLYTHQSNIVHQILGIHHFNRPLVWVDVNATYISPIGREKYGLVVFSDVTERKNAYEKAALFEKVIEAVDVGVTIADPAQEDMPLIYVNPGFTKMTGYSMDEAIGKNCRYLQGDVSNHGARATIRNTLNENKSCNVELENFTKTGEPFQNLLTISPLHLNGKLRYFVGVQHDVSQIKRQREELEQRNLFIHAILDTLEDIVILTDGKLMLYANQMLLAFFGYETFDEFIAGTNCLCDHFLDLEETFSLSSLSSDISWIKPLMTLPANEKTVAMKSIRGDIHYFSIDIKPFGETNFIVTLHDISTTFLNERHLRNIAYHDPLTGAFNRRYFYEYMNTHKRHRGYILADLDNFKNINDTYGHECGDTVLKQTVSVFQSLIRSEEIVVRWGGEEILILIMVDNKDILTRVAEKIRSELERHSSTRAGTITASFGATLLRPEEVPENAIARADKALYTAKSMGKNCVVVE